MITIATGPATTSVQLPRLLRRIGEYFRVRFAPDDECDLSSVAGRIHFVAPGDLPAVCADRNRRVTPTLIVTSAQATNTGWKGPVTFGRSSSVPVPFRTRQVTAQEMFAPITLPVLDGFCTLAEANGQTCWMTEVSTNPVCFISGFPLPVLTDEDFVQDQLNGKTFAAVLPLFEFLRGIVTRGEPANAGYRACLIVDDPNLHWPTYGWVNYRALCDLRKTTPCHFAMATVPFDDWWIDPRAARLFRENPAALSLLVHGAAHERNEFAVERDRPAYDHMLAYAIRRIHTAESSSGVAISRILAPPHGAIREEIMPAMVDFGFEGVTNNRWSLWQRNSRPAPTTSLGLEPADILAGGMPVINRFRLGSPTCLGEILVAAYLGQPIVPYGHHQDFADGMSAVRRTVDLINSLGPVEWMDAGRLFLTNFRVRNVGGQCTVRLFSRRIHLRVPASTSELRVIAPDFPTGSVAQVTIQSQPGLGEAPFHMSVALDKPVAVPPGANLEIRLQGASAKNALSVSPMRVSLRLALRRFASEIRDRLRIH